ncbi:MAG: S-adenosylmethionine:tRNA ribosyltransferase-isomerase, partial [Candidatus Eremiobacteraeota bacterium]|nr:S-adenosylmethionine:tRNA ribosyltransferase-isomerase [Candidatus Eremiobacteraeota bacterium]
MGSARARRAETQPSRYHRLLLPRDSSHGAFIASLPTATIDERLTAAYDYELPSELIAQEHARPRDASRLLVVRGDALEHHIFRELPDILRDDDLLVLNDTRVVAARVRGRRLPTGGSIELLLLRPVAQTQYDPKAKRWFALVKPGRKARAGDRIEFGPLGTALVGAIHADGTREIEFDLAVSLEEFLDTAGRLPLPPYVHTDSEENQQDYQTVFAVNPGSVAAPTAALHFTTKTFAALE